MAPAGTPASQRCRAAVTGGAHRRSILVALAALGALAPRAVPAAAAKATVTTSAGRWLERIRDAAGNRSYQGTMTFSAGGTVSSSRIAHFCDGPERFERIEGLDGKQRLQFRHNDQVVTLWPATRTAVIEQHAGVTDFPGLPPPALHTLEHYDLHHTGSERMTGLSADVLLLRPRDAHRFGQRMWVERDTGLLLRADVLGPRDGVLETSAFTEVVLAPTARPDAVSEPMKRLDGYTVVRPKVVRTRLADEGWAIPRPVPGFELVSCSRRPLEAEGHPAADSPVQVLQAMFCDGLAQVSLFVEPYDGKRHKPMRSALGATRTTMARRGDWWLTVMGEVPMTTLQLFDAALARG